MVDKELRKIVTACPSSSSSSSISASSPPSHASSCSSSSSSFDTGCLKKQRFCHVYNGMSCFRPYSYSHLCVLLDVAATFICVSSLIVTHTHIHTYIGKETNCCKNSVRMSLVFEILSVVSLSASGHCRLIERAYETTSTATTAIKRPATTHCTRACYNHS